MIPPLLISLMLSMARDRRYCRCCYRDQDLSVTPSSADALRELRTSRTSDSRKDGPDLLKMHRLQSVALLTVPLLLFWIVVFSVGESYPAWFENCSPSKGPGQLYTSPTDCVFRDALERPHWFIYAAILIPTIYALTKHRKSPEKLKKWTFAFQLLVTLMIRCLSSFSGWMILPNTWPSYYFILWNSNSVGKAVWLWLLVGPWFWNWTYLGTYTDVRYDEDTRSVVDENGDVVWVFTCQQETSQEDTDEEMKDIPYDPYSPTYMPWQNTIVRLSYIHIIDNLVHTLWLRFYFENSPYTAYVNNSELLTLFLVVIMGIYTFARIKSHVVFEYEEDEEKIDKSGDDIIVARKSATKGLLAPFAEKLPFHRASIIEFIATAAICLLVSIFLATFLELPDFYTAVIT